jgi:ribosome biogenesis protein MAK21
VERFIFRPGLTERARYYAVTFLNQLPLSHRPQEGGAELAQRLVDVYFGLFRLLLEGRVGHAAERAAAAAAAGAAHSGRSTRSPTGPAARGRGGRGGRGGGHRRGATHSNADDGATTAAAQHEAIEAAGELDARMLSALITGVRRAFPYVAPEAVEQLADTHSEALFKLVHTAPFTVALQARVQLHASI